MRYCFDIDGTLCHTPNNKKGKPDYANAVRFLGWFLWSIVYMMKGTILL